MIKTRTASTYVHPATIDTTRDMTPSAYGQNTLHRQRNITNKSNSNEQENFYRRRCLSDWSVLPSTRGPRGVSIPSYLGAIRGH